MYVCITESLCCTLETNTTLQIDYTSIKKRLLFNYAGKIDKHKIISEIGSFYSRVPLGFQSYLCLFTVLYFMPQEYHMLEAPCTHLWFHAVLLLSCCLCLKHPPLCQVLSSSVPMPRRPSTHHSASISLKVSLHSKVKLGGSPLCSQNIYCRMLTLDTDIICFCLSPN